jgi:hypothetical protein
MEPQERGGGCDRVPLSNYGDLPVLMEWQMMGLHARSRLPACDRHSIDDALLWGDSMRTWSFARV